MRTATALLTIAVLLTACGGDTKEIRKKNVEIVKVTETVSLSVQPRSQDIIDVTLFIGVNTLADNREGTDVLLFKGQVIREFTRDHVVEKGGIHRSEEPMAQKIFSGQILSRNFCEMFVDLHCIDELCSQLYAIVQKRGQDRVMGAFVFHRNASEPNVSESTQTKTIKKKNTVTWELKTALTSLTSLTSDLEKISSVFDLITYTNKESDEESNKKSDIKSSTKP